MKYFISFFMLLFLSMHGFSQNKNSEIYFYFSKFYAPDIGPYLEIYSTVVGKSVRYIKLSDNRWQASIDFLMLFKQNGKIKKFKKYNLLSPVVTDSTQKPSFTDVQRIVLDTGNYDFILTIKDGNNILDKGITFRQN